MKILWKCTVLVEFWVICPQTFHTRKLDGILVIYAAEKHRICKLFTQWNLVLFQFWNWSMLDLFRNGSCAPVQKQLLTFLVKYKWIKLFCLKRWLEPGCLKTNGINTLQNYFGMAAGHDESFPEIKKAIGTIWFQYSFSTCYETRRMFCLRTDGTNDNMEKEWHTNI